jgi:RNA polymerase sigma factor (sigma-70 family)
VGPCVPSDEDLLAAYDVASFELFYCHHVDRVLGFFARRTGDPELTADLTAETFAAALAGRRRYRRQAAPAVAWLFGIASNKLADAQRRGYADRRARHRLGMERLEVTDEDIARIDALSAPEATVQVELLAPVQRDAVKAHVVDGREYGDIARELQTTEVVVRKRVSRGLANLRARIGSRS